MRVLHTECGLNWGGQEFRTLLECKWLNSHGHQSWIMCHPDSELYRRCKQQGVDTVIAMNMTRTWRLDIWVRVYIFALQNRVDIINSHGSRDSILCTLAYLLGVPVIRSRQVTNPIKKIFSYQYGCSRILAAAAIIKTTLVEKGVNPEKVAVIGEGVDMVEFSPRPKPSSLIEEFALKDDEKVVVNIGMIRSDKGQKYFAKAAKKLLDRHAKIKFLIVGDATRKKSYKEQLEELITDMGIQSQCLMVGYRDDVADLINLADLVVIASIATEAQSRVVPQSFASKTTVVSTSTGGLTELVKDRVNGLVVPPRDAEAMANAIEAVLIDESLKSYLEAQAYQFALNHLSFETMMKKTLKLYGELL